MTKTRSKKCSPQRDYFAPTTAAWARMAFASPTDWPMPMNRPANGKEPAQHVLEGPDGKTVIEGYRPHQRDTSVLDAVIGGSHPEPRENGGRIYIDSAKIAKKIKIKDPRRVWTALEKMMKTQISIRPTTWKIPWTFQVIVEIKPDNATAKTGHVDFSGTFLRLWRVWTQVYSEGLTSEIAAIKPPVVRALVRRIISNEFVNEPLSDAMRAIDALGVTPSEIKQRYAEVRRAADAGGAFARFRISLKTDAAGVERLHFHVKSLAADDLVHIVPAMLADAAQERRSKASSTP